MTDLESGDIVICTVERIVGTVVFVKIHHENREIEGTIIISEIAPGRIRNLRDYVVPKKRIVCKVLRISGDRIDLSLRRVTQKEKKEILDKNKQEKSYASILKNILKEKAEDIVEKITKEESLYDFFQEAKENPKELEKLTNKEDAEKILKAIKSQKSKNYIIKKEVSLNTTEPNGLELIKNLLGKTKDVEIKYISAGRYSLKTESEDAKQADNKLKDFISQIEKISKKNKINFSVKEK